MSTKSHSHGPSIVSNFIGRLRKVQSSIEKNGVLNTAVKVFVHLTGARLFFLCQLDLCDEELGLKEDSEVRPGVLPQDRQHFVSLGASPEGIPTELEMGTQFFVLEHEGRAVAYMWLQPKSFHSEVSWSWLRFRLAQNDIWGQMVWVAPEYRGQDFGPRVNKHALWQAARAGYTRVLSTVGKYNYPSLRADEKVGYKRLCHFFTLRVGFAVIIYNRSLRVGPWTASRPLELEVDSIIRGIS
jgi:GNAT superfamily N-acetyltransferase